MSLKDLLRDASGTVRIPPGRYHEQLVLTGRRDLRIEAAGVVLDGSRAKKGQSGVRLKDCEDIGIEGLESQHWRQKGTGDAKTGGHGAQLTDCKGVMLIDVRGTENEGSGFLTGGCRDVTVMRGEFSRNGSHGGYFSNGGSNLRADRVIFDTNGRVGLHANGHPKRIKLVRVTDCVLSGNGNVPVQFASVTDGLVKGCRGTNKRPRPVFWSDGEGERFACRDCREENCTWA